MKAGRNPMGRFSHRGRMMCMRWSVVVLVAVFTLRAGGVARGWEADSLNVRVVGRWNTPGDARGVWLDDSYAFVADGGSGLRIISVADPADLMEVGSWDTPGTANSVVVRGDFAYVADGTAGLRVIDIHDTGNPLETDDWNTPGSAEDVRLYGFYAYVADNYGGLRVIDVSDPDSVQEVSSMSTSGFAYALDLDIIDAESTFLFLADYSDGVKKIRLFYPESPDSIDAFDTPGFARDVSIEAGYAYVADGTYGVRVIDAYARPMNEVSAWSGGSVDVVGIDAEDTLLYLAASEWGLYVLTRGTSEPPQLRGYYDTPDVAMNVAARNGYIYIANGFEGLIIAEYIPPDAIEGDVPGSRLPEALFLSQNYPNPFNPTTTITFSVPGDEGENPKTTLALYDLRGRRVKVLVDAPLPAGKHEVAWDGTDENRERLPSGVYLCRLSAFHRIISRKMLLAR